MQPYSSRNNHNSRNSKRKQEQGIVSNSSSRVAKSGSNAHSFSIGSHKYTIFIEDALSPVTDGDRVRFEYEVKTLKSKYNNKYNAIIPESLIIESPVELGADVEGLVYILSNPSMAGILKVGFTTGTATKRAEELSRVTSIPTGFKVEWTLPILGNPKAVEQSAHAHLAKYKHGKEFFKVSLDLAKAACIDSFAKIYPEKALLMDEAFSTRAEKEVKRREELELLAAAHQKVKSDEAARKAFEQSREGRWQSRGVCQLILSNFKSEPNRTDPSFIYKLFGAKFEDYIDFKIKVSQNKEEIMWCVSMSGRKSERRIGEYKYFETKDASLVYQHEIAQRHNIHNCKVTIDIPNSLLENPPPLPTDYLNPEVTLKVESIDDFIIRPEPVKLKRDRFR